MAAVVYTYKVHAHREVNGKQSGPDPARWKAKEVSNRRRKTRSKDDSGAELSPQSRCGTPPLQLAGNKALAGAKMGSLVV